MGQVISNRPDSAPISGVAALHYRDFRLYWIGLFLSNIGTWMQTTALNWLIYEITRSPLQLGMNGLFRAVPAIGLGIISGTIADRFDRKKLMLTTQSVLGTLALLLGVLDHSENIQLWQIYAVTFLSAAVASCDAMDCSQYVAWSCHGYFPNSNSRTQSSGSS